jgi:hypothetical protein
LSPASVASVTSSLRSSNHNRKRKAGDTDNNNNNNNTPSKLLCMVGDELKNDLATILDVRSENLVEKMIFLLNKLNECGVATDTDAAEGAAVSAAAASVAAVSATVSAATVLAAVSAAAVSAAISAAAVSAAVSAATVASAEVSAAAAAAAVLQPPPPVLYTAKTRPPPSQLIEFDENTFHVLDRYGNQRSDAAARMGKSRAVNMLVKTILGYYFSDQHTHKQLVVALRTASKHHKVQMLFKSAGLADVDALDALRFQNEQIHRILRTTNYSKKKSNGTDDI